MTSTALRTQGDLNLEFAIGGVVDMANVMSIVLDAYFNERRQLSNTPYTAEQAKNHIEGWKTAVSFSFDHLQGMISDLQQQAAFESLTGAYRRA
jgi:hypothetical protein